MTSCPFAAQHPVRNHSGALARNLGLVLHVQQGTGSLRHFFDVTANQASSTFWVSRTGVIEQYVDSDVRAWAQAAGNDSYCSVETEGWDRDPLTDAQVNAVAKLYRWGHQMHGWPYAVVDRPGQSGLIYHGAGGKAWGGHPHCLPLDTTEVLTRPGWLPLREVTDTTRIASVAMDSGLIDFAPPLDIIEPYEADLISIGGMEMTPEHRLYVHRSDHPTRKVLTAEEIGAVRTNWLVPAFGTMPTAGTGAGPDLMRLLVWAQADGHYERDPSTGRIYCLGFHFRKQRKIDRVLEILDLLGVDRVSVRGRRDGTTAIRIYGQDWISENLLPWLPEKRWEWSLLNASPAEFAAFDEEVTQADGSERRDMRTYSTAIEANADIVQALYVTHGRSAAKHRADHGWTVQLHVQRQAHALRDTYRSSGRRAAVGCVTTHNDTILIRQGGRVMVVGNCAGDLRDAQRPAIIAAAQGGIPDEQEWDTMASKEEIAAVVRAELAAYDKSAAKRHQQVLAYCTWLQSRLADSIVVSAFWRVLGRGPDAKGRAANVDAVVASKVTPAQLDANLARSKEAGEIELGNRRTADARKP